MDRDRVLLGILLVLIILLAIISIRDDDDDPDIAPDATNDRAADLVETTSVAPPSPPDLSLGTGLRSAATWSESTNFINIAPLSVVQFQQPEYKGMCCQKRNITEFKGQSYINEVRNYHA